MRRKIANVSLVNFSELEIIKLCYYYYYGILYRVDVY